MKGIFASSLIALLALWLTMPASASEPLRWVGCDVTKQAFMKELAAAYEMLYGTKILLEGGGATPAYSRIMDKSADIGGSCKPVNKDDSSQSHVNANPIAWDALVVMVHPDNPLDNITQEQIRQLYSGKITNWKQLGGADRPIELITRRGKESGVGVSIRKLLFDDTGMNFTGSKEVTSSTALEDEIESNPNAIGISGIANALNREVKALDLEGVAASYENIRLGVYPLYRPLYITFSSSNPRKAEIKSFLKLAHSAQGRKIIKEQGVVPYLEASELVMKQRDNWHANDRLAKDMQ